MESLRIKTIGSVNFKLGLNVGNVGESLIGFREEVNDVEIEGVRTAMSEIAESRVWVDGQSFGEFGVFVGERVDEDLEFFHGLYF